MTFLGFLYNSIIGSLKLIFEIVYTIGSFTTQNEGLGIVFLSFVLNILLLPLYKKADEIQKKENDIQNEMKPDIDFIKKSFKGNEQFYVLQTYYRQHDYKPIYSLRSSVSLLLQIPFFIAAYDFLSDLKRLNSVSFGPIADLSKPDGLLFGINLLPVLMTLVNIVSSAVYTKGKPFKQKIQLYVMALFFLFILYQAPSALSLYYLLNNIFSLIKNCIEKFEHKNKIISLFGVSAGLFGIVFVLTHLDGYAATTTILVLLVSMIMFAFSLYYFIHGGLPDLKAEGLPFNKYSTVICNLFLSVFTGLFIPSSVIGTSPEEFVDTVYLISPNSYILNSLSLSLGIFMIWMNVYYAFADEKNKRVFSSAAFIMCGIAILDYFVFKYDLGTMSNLLIYDVTPSIKKSECLINLICIIIVSLMLTVIWKRFNKQALIAVLVLSLTSLMTSLINMNSINRSFIDVKSKLERPTVDSKILNFGKDKDNVIVLMLDRAISTYIPYIIEEKPELQEQFSGFVFYPNTISFGAITNTGAPGIYGGYEYIPEMMNKRDDELLSDKHNEALKVLPVLFDENGFDSVVLDPPYAGYSWIPDLSIYDDYPDIKAFNITQTTDSDSAPYLKSLNRNLFLYSITRTAPSVFFDVLYGSGSYLSPETEENGINDAEFMSNYQALKELSEITDFRNDKGLFLEMQNSTTHEHIILQEPDYVPSYEVDNSEYTENDSRKKSITGSEIEITDEYQLSHYHVDIATFIELGKWFDYLKEIGVYDNTRIIIVSDHGTNLGINKDLLIHDDDMLFYNALLMVKDYNSEGFRIDNSFMTNADVPYLATVEVIDNPVNPFTGNRIEEMTKNSNSFNVFGSLQWDLKKNDGYRFSDDKWYSVHDNCLNPDCWEVIEDPSK